jgi:hypothetical protein
LPVVDHAGQRGMLRRQDQARSAVDGVDAGGEDAELAVFGALHREIDFRTLRPANPIALHGQDALRPAAFQLLQIVQQFVGVFGDAQKPLRQRALLDRRSFMTPAAAIHHLFVGQHGAAFRTPVQQRLLAVGQAALEHAQEEPLIPLVVFGLAGGDFTRPVVAEAHAAVLPLHGFDVGVGPLTRVAVVLDGRVFGGQTEGVPAHGVQHVEAAHPFIAGQRVANGVVAHVADVQRAAGVRQHLQHVILGAGGVLFRLVERRVAVPAVVPFQFQLLRVVLLFGHRVSG